METRTIRYITIMVFCVVAFILSAFSYQWEEGLRLTGFGIIISSYMYWIPENEKKTKIKGTMQYDTRNYESVAMRILFNEDPLNLINYEEVTLRVDKNADLKEEKHV